MIKPNSSFADGGIAATSFTARDVAKLWYGEFDIALVAASWDVRCTAVTRCSEMSVNKFVLLRPDAKDDDGDQDRNLELIRTWALKNSKSVFVSEFNSINLRQSLNELRSVFWKTAQSRDESSPIRVFIDVSTCPRYISLALLKEFVLSGIVSEVVLGYSEGVYPAAVPSYGNLEELAFNDGVLQAIPVPGMFGEFDASKERFFLVSVGFDGWKTLNLIVRKEPERVAILLGSPGVEPDYEQRSLSANRALIDRYAVDEDRIVRARAGDAVAAWREVTERHVENFECENVYYLCAGNKPHSIALALRAISCNSAALLYNQPACHSQVRVKFADVFWAYSVRPIDGVVLG